MKRLAILILMLPAFMSASAQGCIKGTVCDAETREPLPFVKVLLLHDGERIKTVETDFDGVYTMKTVDSGRYDIVAEPCVGYLAARRNGVMVKPTGFTACNIDMERGGTWTEVEVVGTPTLESINVDSIVAAVGAGTDAQVELMEYKVVDRGLKRMLDRVVECKEHMYAFDYKPERMRKGTACNLKLAIQPCVDTVSRNEYGTWQDYLYDLYSYHLHDTSLKPLPLPLDRKAPKFQLDKPLVKVWVNTSYHGKADNRANGYTVYRGVIFYLNTNELGAPWFKPTGRKRTFRCMKDPYVGIWDPPTWIYTRQEGHWYRWLELPIGY